MYVYRIFLVSLGLAGLTLFTRRWEQVFGNEFGSCPSGPPQDPDDPPPKPNIQRNLSLALAKQMFPSLDSAQLEAQAAEQYSSAATELLVAVLATARETRPNCALSDQ